MNSFDDEGYEVAKPVSPSGQYFNSSVLCAYILGFLESEIPIDDSHAISLLKDVFLPINPRFSSIMVRGKRGEKQWKKVKINLEEHINVPVFPAGMSLELYDAYFNEYFNRIAIEQTPQDRPLWEVHIIKFPTSNAAGTLIFKLHHALGDGYSLMGALLSCLQRADNPSLPLSFPQSRRLPKQEFYNKGFFKKMSTVTSMFFSAMYDLGWGLLKSSVLEDDKSPLWSGDDKELKLRSFALSNILIPLDDIKEIKTNLGVSANDVITGIIFFGIRQYMQEMNYKSRNARTTALVMLNTRNIRAYQSIEDMLRTDSKGPWGNLFSFLHVGIPKLSNAELGNPLEFVRKARKLIKRKRHSLAVPLTASFLNMVKKLRGPEVAAKYIYRTLKMSSMVISNIVGPQEQMALENHPIRGLYFTMTGGPESAVITVMSYMGTLRVTLRTEKGFIEEQKFKTSMEHSFEEMLKSAREIPKKS